MPQFSLRGKVMMIDNSRLAPLRIFDYVSPDRTRGWKVISAHIWPLTTRADTGSTEGKIVTDWALATDDGSAVDWNHVKDPSENRTFAWGTWAGYLREWSGGDFITPEYAGEPCFLIDPDTFVVKELWIQGACTTESTTNPEREYGYMIVLEEQKISPSLSVFQQIKGMGQDV